MTSEIIREARLTDFEAIWKLAGRAFEFDPSMKPVIKEEYEALVTSPASRTLVLCSVDRQGSEHIQSYVAMAFISRGFFEECLNADTPFICRRFNQWQKEGRNPFLTYCEMVKFNANDGLDLVFIDWLWDDTLSPKSMAILRRRTILEFVRIYGGWQLRWFICEACFPELHEELTAAKFFPLNEYAQWKIESDTQSHNRFQPTLFGINRQQAYLTSDLALLDLFLWDRPKCRFTDDQRTVLELIARGLPDDHICAVIGSSSDALRKVKSRIVEKIGKNYADIIVESWGLQSDQIRKFVADHLFELRPISLPKRRRAGPVTR